MFRIAIAEAERTPEIAQARDASPRAASRDTRERRRVKSLLAGDVNEMSDVFRSLLLGDVMIGWLLGTRHAPGTRDLKPRAQRAATTFMRIYAA